MTIQEVATITNRIDSRLFGRAFDLRVEFDQHHFNGRIFLQVQYLDACRTTGQTKTWSGRKWYLSKFMTEDERFASRR
jgi:hypothetical protein